MAEKLFVRVIMALYKNDNIQMRVDGGLSEELSVNIGMHQGSVAFL